MDEAHGAPWRGRIAIALPIHYLSTRAAALAPWLQGDLPVLSQRGRYALKAMVNLARADASRQVSAISAEENIPRKFLEAIMSELRRAGLVESARGKTGGYRLARPADLITFGEVIRLTDGPLALAPCVSRNFYKRCDDCLDEATCTLRRVLARVRNEASEILDQTTLADALAAGPSAPFLAGGISETVGGL